MSNMSYCRFENTRRDLDDCHAALEALFCLDVQDGHIGRGISDDERRYAKQLIGTCREILKLVMDEADCDDIEALTDSMIEDAVETAHEAYTDLYNEEVEGDE